MQNSLDSIIQGNINQLITNFNPTATQQLRQEIQAFSRHLFSNTAGSQNVEYQDPLVFKNKILQKVSRIYDSESTQECCIAIDRLLNSKAIRKKTYLLKTLITIADQLKSTHQYYGISTFESRALQDHEDNFSQNQANLKKSNLNKDPQYYNVETIKRFRNRGDLNANISQSDILRDIVSAMNNIEGKYLKYQEGYYSLRNEVRVNDTVRQMVKELSDLGWLYRRIIEKEEKTDILERGEDRRSEGVIRKALKMGVEAQIQEHFRWLMEIDRKINMEDMSFRKLAEWTYQPIERLKWLCIIMESVEHFQGCQIISIINSYRPQGDIKINKILNNLMDCVLQPLFQFIYNWVYHGDLIDQKKEFFIAQTHQTNDVWTDRFHIVKKNIPTVIDIDSAYKIFITGKTIYYLKNKCKYNYAIREPFLETRKIVQSQMQHSTNILSEPFKKWVDSIDKQTNKQLVRVLLTDFKLSLHLDAMKKFFLFGQGDFIQHLADSLKLQLSKPKQQIFQYNLQGYVADAMKSCFQNSRRKQNNEIQYFRESIIPRIIPIRIECNGSDGWSLFNFTYGFGDHPSQDPIYAIICPETLLNYQRVFRFLWNLKRVEQNLKEVWVSHAKAYLDRNRQRQYRQIFQFCYLLRNSMIHFVNNLYNYIMIGIESFWSQFLLSLQNPKSFDDILGKHKHVVNQILQLTFNTLEGKKISDCLIQLFEVITTFTTLQWRFQQNYQQYLNRKKVPSKHLGNNRTQQIDLSMFEELSHSIVSERTNFDQSLQMKSFQETKAKYQQSFRQFYDTIKKESSDFSILVNRLDFNEYYTNAQYELEMFDQIE